MIADKRGVVDVMLFWIVEMMMKATRTVSEEFGLFCMSVLTLVFAAGLMTTVISVTAAKTTTSVVEVDVNR